MESKIGKVISEETSIATMSTARCDGRELSISLALPHEGNSSITFRKVPSSNREEKKWLSSVHIKTGDEEFDRSVLVETEDNAFATVLLHSVPRRAAILALLEQGAIKVQLLPKEVVATYTDPLDQTKVSKVKSLSEPYLNTLRRNLPALTTHKGGAYGPARRADYLDEQSDTPKQEKGFAEVLLSALITATFIFLYDEVVSRVQLVESQGPWVEGAILGTLLTLLVTTSLILGAKITKVPSLLNLAKRSLLILPPSIPLGGILALFINCNLDNSPPKLITSTVVGKRIYSDQKLVAVVEAWNDPGRTLEIKIDPWAFSNLEPYKSKIRYVAKSGRLGYLWFDNITFG